MGVETELLGLKNRYDGKEFRLVEREDGTIAVLAGDVVIADSGVLPVTAAIPSGEGIEKISAGDTAPPAAVLINADGRERKRLLVWGHSIAEQCLPNAATFATKINASTAVPKGALVLPVQNGAALSANDKISVRLYDAHYWMTSVVSVAGNDVTIADATPAYIKPDATVTKVAAPLTRPVMLQSYGCASAAMALLGMPVEVIAGYGYGGATQLQMIVDFERQIRFYRPDYVWVHMYENDLADGGIAGGASVDLIKERTRLMCRLAQSYGAVPIIVNSGPYYKAGPIGISGTRVADYDALAAWTINGLPVEVPGVRGVDISMAYTDPAYINDNYGRRPLAGYTDGVHLNFGKRFYGGQLCAPQVKSLFPAAGSLVVHSLSGRDLTLVSGAGGTGVNLQPGSEVPQGWKFYTGAENGTANGTAVARSSRNADGSLRVTVDWPGAASNSADTASLQYLFGANATNWNLSTVPPSWVGTNREFCVYARIKFRELAGVASIAPVADLRPSYDSADGAQSIDMLDSMPISDDFVVLTTPNFTLVAGTVSLTVRLTCKPKASASPANARAVFDVYELGVLPAHPEIPAEFI